MTIVLHNVLSMYLRKILRRLCFDNEAKNIVIHWTLNSQTHIQRNEYFVNDVTVLLCIAIYEKR
jgi:hypothetical protein